MATMGSKQLEVWLQGARIGTLMQVDGRLAFAYTTDWLQAAAARPLSQSLPLPLQAEMFDERASRPFFAGLLPKGDKRRLVAPALQVSRQNDFGLLDGIGGECAGAVTLLEVGQLSDSTSSQHISLDQEHPTALAGRAVREETSRTTTPRKGKH